MERKSNLDVIVQRGQVWFAKLEGEGSTQSGEKPVVIVQNHIACQFSPVCTVLPLTSKNKKHLPTHTILEKGQGGVFKRSVAMAEQIVTISKSQIIPTGYLGTIPENKMQEIENTILIQMGIKDISKINIAKAMEEIDLMKEDIQYYEDEFVKNQKERNRKSLILAVRELKQFCIENNINYKEHIDEKYEKLLNIEEINKRRRVGLA